MALTDKNILLVANPAAQRGNGAQAAQEAYGLLREATESGSVELAMTECAGHATGLVAGNAADGRDIVVALGGDGIVHEVVNGLMRRAPDDRPAFGLIPIGSGNDFARTLGMAADVHGAVHQLEAAHVRTLDIGRCNDAYFAETLSFGLDAAIALDTVERRARTGQQGTALYLASGLDILLHHLREYRFDAHFDDGRTIEGTVLMFAVQNGQTYGGGFRICPEARPDDGLLDICYAEAPMSMPEATYKFLSAKNARHVGKRGIRFERAASLELRFEGDPPCQMDGECFHASSYRVSLLPGALRALSPAR